MKIIVEPQGCGFRAKLEAAPLLWKGGVSEAEALGNLVHTVAPYLNIELTYLSNSGEVREIRGLSIPTQHDEAKLQ